MYSIWTDECRKCKISPWISMRMNDGHGARDETHFYHSKFWREHPEYRRAEYRYMENSNFESRWAHTPLDRLLDYAHPQVREYQMAYIKECLEMYDVDGIDLDFLRYEYCFRPGFEEQGIEIMDAFIKEAAGYVKEWEQKRGHAIGLGVRVSVDPQMALSFGFDVFEWARQGWITRVTPMQHYTNAFLGAPYKLWERLLNGTKVTLCGGTDIGVCAGSGCKYGKISSAVTRAAACSMLYKGVERIFLFNFWPGYSLTKDYLELVSHAGSLDTLKGLHKRYLVSFVDSEVPGEASARMLPLGVKANRVHDVRIHLGKIEGETLRICIGAPEMKEEKPCFKIRLNGVDCPYQGTADMPLPNPAHGVFTFEVPSSAAHNGYNNIEITGLRDITVDWVEVEACCNK